jgi:protein-S-isoprenylcysteine O-methyltransferase Ste14
VGEVISAVVLAAVNPEVLNQRGTLMRPDTKRFEKILLPTWLVVAYASAAVAGLDAVRFEWSALPAALIPVGIILMSAAYVIGTWAMAVNPFFESTVRIQTERGHRPVTSGPYRFVRHPGYLGAIVGSFAGPFLLGSAWMLIPVLAAASLFVLRAALEDRTLARELSGYSAYMGQTRYRLLPGLW